MSLFETLTTCLAGPLGYFGVFGLLVACGMGVPVPEDIILISGGYIAQAAGVPPWLMMATGLVGIICGDSVIYWLGRHFGMPFAQKTFLKNFLTPDRMDRVHNLFKEHGEKMIMAARFMPGVRAVTFFTAGTTRVKYHHFVFFDGLAALVSAPLWVYLGYRFGGRVVLWAHKFQGVLLTVATVALIGSVASQLMAARRKSAAPVPPEPAPGTD